MAILGPTEPLPYRPSRILIGGATGAGKTTLARVLAATSRLPHTEIDALHHGPYWTPRPTFLADVEQLAAQPDWITEYQYDDARPILLDRCDLVVYLALPRSIVMSRVIARTVRRARRREVLWNGNVEPPLRTVLTDRDHVIRWAWKTHGLVPERIAEIAAARPELPIVVLHTPRAVAEWLRRVERSGD